MAILAFSIYIFSEFEPSKQQRWIFYKKLSKFDRFVYTPSCSITAAAIGDDTIAQPSEKIIE